jgi:hypothetical protein
MTFPREPSPGSGWSIICCSAALHPFQTPVALTAIVNSHSSSVSSRMVCSLVKTPALLTMMSSRPNEEAASATSSWTCASRRVSHSRYSTPTPRSAISASVGSSMSPS